MAAVYEQRGMEPMHVDHVSIAVHDIDAALQFFRCCLPIDMRVEKRPGYTDDFNWCDFYIGQFKLELIEATRPDSFVRRFIDKRGEGMHHMSLEVTRLKPVLDRLEADDIRIVDRFDAGDGALTAFISPRSAFGVLIQFWQNDDIVEPQRPTVVPFTLRSGEAVSMRVDHVSIAVHDVNAALAFFRRYFPIEIRREKHLYPDETFALASFWLNGYKIELIQPAEGRPPGFVSRFLDRRGQGLHHLSIHVDRFDPFVAQLEADGVRVVDKTARHNGLKTGFISPRSAHGVLIQLWEDPMQNVALESRRPR